MLVDAVWVLELKPLLDVKGLYEADGVQVLSPVAEAVTLAFTDSLGLTLSDTAVVADTLTNPLGETLLLIRPVKDPRTEADTEEEALLVFVLV